MDRNRFLRSLMAFVSRNDNSFQELLFSYYAEIMKTESPADVITGLDRAIHQVVSPRNCFVFTFDASGNCYASNPDQNGQRYSDLRFAIDSPLVGFLKESAHALLLSEKSSFPIDLEKEYARIAILNPEIIIPLMGLYRLVGWVMLGKNASGAAYSPKEIRHLEFICKLSSQWVEKLDDAVISKKKSQEMTVLVQISQGINLTSNLDDALELVYSRIQQIVPLHDFQILIRDDPPLTSRYVFFVGNGQRRENLEDHPFSTNDMLCGEVLRSQSALLTEDYQQECRSRGLLPTSTDIYTWMGIPLNTGTDTFGVVEIGNRNATVTYSLEQLNLVQAIADQIAGSIFKARLLEETRRRAHQLEILNEASRKLSSTFDLQILIQHILKISLDLLNSRSGMLSLVEQPDGSLITSIVAGQVPSSQVGKQAPYETKLALQLEEGGEPVILDETTSGSNAPQSENDTWPQYRTRLVAPLQFKDRMIGVIDLFDRLDNRRFDQDDQALLHVFASQAAIALEMTQSYVKTDLALAARVEELSVMQQIDRELNNSLEIDKAMGITLDWATRQSKAGAGLIGLIEESGIQVMSSKGYTNELARFLNTVIPPEAFPVQKLLQDNQPVIIKLTSNSPAQNRLLENCRSQIIVPIMREIIMIGVILLESRQPDFWSEDDLAFLTRLSDHASVAIFNAQLYHVVRDANNAKSEFVSFVAHELKNPMTSIKGYTDLLAAGAVGPVTPHQSNFLATIRSNIDRMNTLISELNDLSKIEAGRLRLDFTSFRISEVVEEAIRSIRRQVEEKNQSLSIEIPPELPPIWADRTRMIQILVNLISNANKYTPRDGHILVCAQVNQDTQEISEYQKTIHLWVEDNGIGISEEDQKRIFQKFFRSEDPKTRETTGTGLGLNITRSLVEMQGGNIWFESRYRQGTTFHLTIPIAS